MLTTKHQNFYDQFYESTHDNEYLDDMTKSLVGLCAALTMNCAPCTSYYLQRAKKSGINKEIVAEVLAKVIAVAAGQKRLQLVEVVNNYEVDLDSFNEG